MLEKMAMHAGSKMKICTGRDSCIVEDKAGTCSDKLSGDQDFTFTTDFSCEVMNVADSETVSDERMHQVVMPESGMRQVCQSKKNPSYAWSGNEEEDSTDDEDDDVDHQNFKDRVAQVMFGNQGGAKRDVCRCKTFASKGSSRALIRTMSSVLEDSIEEVMEDVDEDNDDVFLPNDPQDKTKQMDGCQSVSDYELENASITTAEVQEQEDSRSRSLTWKRDKNCHEERDHAPEEATCRWSRQIEYILISCGFINGLYGILKFPELVLTHNGGVFVVAYLLLLVFCGFPLLYMEMILGQYARAGPLIAWDVIPMFKGVGYSMVIMSVAMFIYNHLYICWAMVYSVVVLSSTWDPECSNKTECSMQENNASMEIGTLRPITNGDGSSRSTAFSYPESIKQSFSSLSIHNDSLPFLAQQEYQRFYVDVVNLSPTIENLGQLQWPTALSTVGVWIIIFIMTLFGPRSIGKASYVTVCLSVVSMAALLIKCAAIEGAIDGIKFFLSLHWGSLGNLQIWLDAAHMMFITLGLGTGCHIFLTGHTHFHSHCFRNAMLMTIFHLIGTMIYGLMSLSVIGAFVLSKNISINSLRVTGLDISFVIFPEVLHSPMWLLALYVMLLLIGVDTQSIYVQNLLSGAMYLLIKRKWFHWKYKTTIQAGCCGFLFLISLFFTSQSGLYIHYLLIHSVSLLSLPLITLTECMTLAWIYGAQRLWNNVADMTGTVDSPWWKVAWKVITPALLMVCIILEFLVDHELSYSDYRYPSWTCVFIYTVTFLPVLPIPILACVHLANLDGSFSKRWKDCTKTPPEWGPGTLGNLEHHTEVPEYVICAPDTFKPEHGLALLTANLYIPNLSNLVAAQDTQDEEMASGYLSDLTTLDSGDSDATEEDPGYRGKWSSRLDFVLSCLGYVVGLGNVWRFPYLVYKNGGGAFFIPYLVMLIFCGIPLVYLELAFGQYASLGPITVWRSVPLFKGIGMSMVLSSAIVSIYYNAVNAWAFHFFFSSMTALLPWQGCTNRWNTENCMTNKFVLDNCTWVNQSYIIPKDHLNNTCVSTIYNCSVYGNNDTDVVQECIASLLNDFGDKILLKDYNPDSSKKSPSEEYFYNRVLNTENSDFGHLGIPQWELALCLLLAWVIVFVCLVRGVRTSGKVAYLIVTLPFIIMFALLIRAFMMDGYLQGIKFYVTPIWSKLKEPHVWGDAAVQVFFSLSACMGGLTTLASYNKFHNNIYSDAILVCLGDTLMSVLSGFSVFAIMGVLATELNTSVENVIQSGIGLTFIVNPAAMTYFPVAPLWSLIFFAMILMMGLSTQFVYIETVITAIMDENFTFVKRRRTLTLLILCSFLYILGIPLTTQGGMYLLQCMDEYVAGFPILINGIFICIAIGWIYGVQQFATDIKHMIGQKVGIWWKAMWLVVSPIIILFILIFSITGYVPLNEKLKTTVFPPWAEAIGFVILFIPVSQIPLFCAIKLLQQSGSFLQRLKQSCLPESNWGPSMERHWRDIEYFPAVNANTLSVDIEHSLLHTVTDHVDFTTVGVRVPSLSSQTNLLPKSLSPKRPRDMRERAILNHAYSNPQCHQSTASIEKQPSCSSRISVDKECKCKKISDQGTSLLDDSVDNSNSSSSSNSGSSEKTKKKMTVRSKSLSDSIQNDLNLSPIIPKKHRSLSQSEDVFFGPDVLIVPKPQKKVSMCDAATQTDYISRSSRKNSQKSPKTSTSSQSSRRSCSDDYPAVLEVEVTQF